MDVGIILLVLSFLAGGPNMNPIYILKERNIVFPAERPLVLLCIITLRMDLSTALKAQGPAQGSFTNLKKTNKKKLAIVELQRASYGTATSRLAFNHIGYRES